MDSYQTVGVITVLLVFWLSGWICPIDPLKPGSFVWWLTTWLVMEVVAVVVVSASFGMLY